MLITLTGPTGSGKSTLAQALIEQGVILVPTWTTRELRHDERGRGDIVHVTREALAASEMLETAEYDGHRYGTPVTQAVRNALAGQGIALKILEPQGLAMLRSSLGTAQRQQGNTPLQAAHVYVDVKPQTALRRLMARCGGMPSSADQRRLDRAADECRTWPQLCDWSHVIDNNLERASMAAHATGLLKALGVSPSSAPEPDLMPAYSLPSL